MDLVGAQLQAEARRSLGENGDEPSGVRLVLEPQMQSVGAPYDDDFTTRVPLPPLLRPAAEVVVREGAPVLICGSDCTSSRHVRHERLVADVSCGRR